MADLVRCYSKGNLLRSWRWINSNPSPQYKNYFRDLYSSFALSVDANIDDLAAQLKNNSFMPSSPSQIFIPKSNCITRPMTLLTIEDQIVYQAFINIIAEKLVTVARKFYYDTTFGNLYAGKSSPFFYRKWQIGYYRYNAEIKNAYYAGYDYSASFDLTACYDSIDHKTLTFFLNSYYGLDKEFSFKLCELLSKWSTSSSMFKGHGIPQGPMASGLLAEAILLYFDIEYKKKNHTEIKYFRYVDDIRLLAKDELSLKKMLVRLDYNCKQIGLFPQSSKIEVHKINNIEREIKQLSLIIDEVETLKINQNQKKIAKTFLKLTKYNKISDVTKFKIYLANVKPNTKISHRLIDLLRNYPKYSPQVANYLRNYRIKVPSKVVDKILLELHSPEIYQIINADLIEGIKDNLIEQNQNRLTQYVLERWEQRDKEKLNPVYRSVLVSYLLDHNLINYQQLRKFIEAEKDWWVTISVLKHINPNFVGEVSYQELMRMLLKRASASISIVAAHEMIKRNYTIYPPYTNINYVAQRILKHAGIIGRSASRPSVIPKCLDYICGKKLPQANWKNIMGNDHKQAEKVAVRAYGYVQNDMSAFVNILDSFNDMLLNNLTKHDKRLPKYVLGKIGGVTNNRNTKLEQYYPQLFLLCKTIHDKRLECDLSHPITLHSNKPTKPIEYKFIYKTRKIIFDGYTELVKNWLSIYNSGGMRAK